MLNVSTESVDVLRISTTAMGAVVCRSSTSCSSSSCCCCCCCCRNSFGLAVVIVVVMISTRNFLRQQWPRPYHFPPIISCGCSSSAVLVVVVPLVAVVVAVVVVAVVVVSKGQLESPCLSGGRCSVANSECHAGICLCLPHFYHRNNVCRMYIHSFSLSVIIILILS